ncbi:hypothetical protein Cgig2_011389 [Carnegiea gigantea]|uniref:Cation-transporting P-type ATPase N-terminal domain-containing protein n=1 Tax=Carnegiea gigantea TaxID=171969 RepID=A0A9Q1QN17_9CARY|nr:hypothetical protein Cgig2_011389 [Carnegiea gigantea]
MAGGAKGSSLEDIKNENVDLEKIPIDEVFEQLKCSREGLSSEEGANRLQIFGPNKLEEKKESKILKFLGFMWNPLSWVMEAAALMAIVLANGEQRPPDWQDFVGIIVLLVINSTISFIEENNAGNAAAALMANLAPKTKVLRDGRWSEQEAAILVPGDIISIKLGDIVPADARLLEGDPLKIDQSALTGESLPVTKNPGEEVFSGSTCKQGEIEAVVIATGILTLCGCKEDVKKKVHATIDKFAERGLRSLAVARQEVPEKNKDSPGGPWQFVGLLPLFDPPRHDSAETIKRALNLGVNVKMITGDQLAIAKETGRRLGMGTNMYPSSSLLGRDKDSNVSGLPVDELIEKADGFAGVFPEHKYEIVKKLQERKHICGMTGDGVNDAPALKKADIGIAVADATDAARSASDIVLTEPGLSVIISAVLTSRAIFQRMKNYTFGFMFIALIWKFDFAPFMVLIIAILNDGTIMTISKDRVKPSPQPDSWKLKEIFATGIVLGGYLALMTVVFFWAMRDTSFFTNKFHVKPLNHGQMMAALYLQVSVISQALIFVTRSRSWSYVERPGLLLLGAFLIAQLIATAIAVYANWGFARIEGMGWGWAGVVWVYSLVTYIPLDILKFAIRYILSGRAWLNLLENKTAFTTKKDYGIEEREAQWAAAQRTMHGLQPPETTTIFSDKTSYRELSEIAEQAKRRAEIARLRELHTLKGHVESVVKLKGLDIDTIQQHYTL